MAVDINRGSQESGGDLPPELSQEVWQKTQAASVVMGLARKIELSGRGTVYHEIVGDSTPEFIGETERKPVDNPKFERKTLVPHKLAVVQTSSNEFQRDLPGLYNALLGRLPGAFARAFDRAALHGINAPAADFDDLSGATAVS